MIVSAFVVPVIGVLRLTLAAVAGQSAGALVLDLVAPAPGEAVTRGHRGGCGVGAGRGGGERAVVRAAGAVAPAPNGGWVGRVRSPRNLESLRTVLDWGSIRPRRAGRCAGNRPDRPLDAAVQRAPATGFEPSRHARRLDGSRILLYLRAPWPYRSDYRRTLKPAPPRVTRRTSSSSLHDDARRQPARRLADRTSSHGPVRADRGRAPIRRWTRDTIIEKIREWEARYGEPPCSADWNPSLARWRAQEWRIERYQEGVWPSTNAVKRPFGGSFDAAVRAAGFVPARPGPRRAAGLARPAVEQREPLAPRATSTTALARRPPSACARPRRASPRSSAAWRRRAPRGARRGAGRATLAAARAAPSEQAGRARRARERSRVDRARAASDAQPKRSSASRSTPRRACAPRPTRPRRPRATRPRPAGPPAPPRRARPRPRRAPRRPSGSRRSARAELASEGAAARRRPRRRPPSGAPRRRERTARELATLVCGEPRRLTPDELDALRVGGPSGPAVLARALKELARARAVGNGELVAALSEVASAAIRWRDRL